MKTYTALFAQDVPHYGATEVQAEDPAQALQRAKSIDPAEICLDPDWENPVCSRIVHITDETGASVAHDIALDGYVLHHESEPHAALCAKAPALWAALKRIAAIPLWGEHLSDPILRAEYSQSGEYDDELQEFQPSADTESSYLVEAVETAREALVPPSTTARPHHSHVRVIVRGGLVQGAETLDGEPVLVEVIDYDVDTSEPEGLDTDTHGAPCSRYTA